MRWSYRVVSRAFDALLIVERRLGIDGSIDWGGLRKVSPLQQLQSPSGLGKHRTVREECK